MQGGVTIIGFGWIAILEEVIPHVPFPDDLAAFWIDRLDLDNGIRHQELVLQEIRVKTGRYGLFARFAAARIAHGRCLRMSWRRGL